MMTYIPSYARNGRQAMIAQAFEPKTLMGLGCSCAGAAGADGVMRSLVGLGDYDFSAARRIVNPESCNNDPTLWKTIKDSTGKCLSVCSADPANQMYELDPSFCGAETVTAPMAPIDTTKPSTSPSDTRCNTYDQYQYGVAINGKCYSYCTTDPTVYEEVGMDHCLRAGGSGGSSSLKLTPNLLIIGAVAIGAIILLQQ